MKRAAWVVLGIVAGYWKFRDDLTYWLPAWGAVYGGQIIGQSVILGILALIVFGSVVFLAKDILDSIFE